MSERKLVGRRRKFSKGKAIRVSDLVYDFLDKQRRQRSWDEFFRRMFGLPDRKGVSHPLVEGMLETTTGLFLLKLESTSWEELEQTAFRMAESIARKKQLKSATVPLRMREAR